MLLFHGTSTALLGDIRTHGLDRPYLTDDLEIAQYYAECATDEVGGESVVLEVEVDESILLPDVNAISEPVLRDEDEVMERFSSVPEDWQGNPDAWRVTLDLVGSVRCAERLRI